MAVPKFTEFFRPVLVILLENGEKKIKDMCPIIAERMNLSKEDMGQMIPSRKKLTYKDRIDWAVQYLKNAGLIERVAHGTYRIGSEGERALASGETIDLNYLEQYESFRRFHNANGDRKKTPDIPNAELETEATPYEIMDKAFNEINSTLASELLNAVTEAPPEFFERLVVDLLLAMGYGYDEHSGKVVGKSGDGGIDGIVKEDKLGFSHIYVQAKRWNEDNKVTSPQLQAFVGALIGRGATKGLFITTGKYTKEARKVAEETKAVKLILVDGEELARLMIAFGIGVSAQTTYTVMRMDTDYFEN